METSWKPHNEKLRQVESIAAFASFIEEYLVPDHAKLNVELLEAIGRWKDESEGVANTNHRGWHSPRTLFDRGEDALIALGRHIRTGLAHSVRRYWPDFHPARHRVALDAWANVNGKGAFNSPHNHDQLLQYETFDTMAFYAGAFGR